MKIILGDQIFDEDFDALRSFTPPQGAEHSLNRLRQEALDERIEGNAPAVHLEKDLPSRLRRKELFLDEIGKSFHILKVKTRNPDIELLIGDDRDEIVLLRTQEFFMLLLAEDLDLGLDIFLKTLRND